MIKGVGVSLLYIVLVVLGPSIAFHRRTPKREGTSMRTWNIHMMSSSPPPLSQRVKEAAIQKFSPAGDVSRIVKCWDNFVGGKTLDRFVDGNEEIKQTAECYVDGLRAVCFHDTKDFSWTAGLEAKAGVILQELTEYEFRRRRGRRSGRPRQQSDADTDIDADNDTITIEDGYIQNVGPSGDGGDGEWLGPRDTTGNHYGPEWKTLGLQDRSVWSDELRGEFPRTIEVLESNKVPSCEAFFAKQGPHSGLLPHSDKNNFIITCHLGLDVPEGDCFIRVGDQQHYWKNGKTCIFDTSIIHSTRNDSPRTRYVLLIRFWHPDLTALEVDMFKFIFEFLDHAALGEEALELFEMKQQILLGKDQHAACMRVSIPSGSGGSGGTRQQRKESDIKEEDSPSKKKKKKTMGGGGGFG
jgi:hypothetical protein